jgi:hypothetical protein
MEQARKQFFFAKKNQKTLAYEERMARSPRVPFGKSFCVFFQKEALSYFSPANHPSQQALAKLRTRPI